MEAEPLCSGEVRVTSDGCVEISCSCVFKTQTEADAHAVAMAKQYIDALESKDA